VSAEVRVGTSGWSYRDWKGVVYPGTPGPGFRALAYLSEFFDTVEINTTFYHPPSPRSCERWLEDVAGNPAFRFTVKLWQRFTHEPEWEPGDVDVFLDAVRPLLDSRRVGALLVQFPWSFDHSRENAEKLKRLADAFQRLPLALELRNASWDNDKVLDWLRRHGVGFCNIDQPASRRSITGTDYVTGPMAYYRLHGRNRDAWFDKSAGRDQRYDYLYSAEELDPWISRIDAAREKAEQVYVMANNHFRGQAPVNALQLRAALSGGKVRVPPSLIEYYPVLQGIARED